MAYRYRLKLVPRQRPNYEGDWIEVETVRPAPTNFLNATKFFAPFYQPDQMVVSIDQIRDGAVDKPPRPCYHTTLTRRPAMTTNDVILLVQQYDRLLEEGNEDAIRRFLAEYPGIPNYDDRGNYVGPVANENGWTP